jgi:hypothetical protein
MMIGSKLRLEIKLDRAWIAGVGRIGEKRDTQGYYTALYGTKTLKLKLREENAARLYTTEI